MDDCDSWTNGSPEADAECPEVACNASSTHPHSHLTPVSLPQVEDRDTLGVLEDSLWKKQRGNFLFFFFFFPFPGLRSPPPQLS